MILAHPAFVLFASALVASLVNGTARKLTLLLGTALALLAWSRLDFGSTALLVVGDYTLSLIEADRLSLVFGLVLTLIAAIGTLYALHNDRRGEHASTLVYAGGSLGVVFAGDWITLFVFWELMAVSSLFVIWYGDTARANRAGHRYLLVHVFGGSCLFAGILLHLSSGGSLAVEALTGGGGDPLAFWLVLTGVAINAAILPLHAWLTDAYPEASVTGSVFLSAFTTKTAVYVLVRVFPGAEILVTAGVAMALYGVVYAMLENDIRRLLAYHIVSQVGYMVAGVGMGTSLALDGATAHAFSHILYKALLFMGAGAVIHATGLRKLTELGGIGHRMKLVVLLYAVGAFSISGVPLFNGFISKAMVVSAAAEAHRPAAELLLTLASVGTFLSIGLKLPYFTFFGPKTDTEVRPVPANMLAAMGIGAFLCTAYGVAPSWLYRMLPYGSDYHPFTVDHVASSTELLVGTAIGFYWLAGKLGGKATVSVDTDWLYRKPFPGLVQHLVTGARRFGDGLQWLSRTATSALWSTAQSASAADVGREPRSHEHDAFRFRLPIGVTVFWIVVYFALMAVAALVRL